MTDKPADGAIASVQFIASAGTGKTHQVTSLYAALILGRPYPEEKLGPLKAGAVFDGATRIPCEEILMLTFARNAASEMRSRIIAEIERQLDRDPDRADFYWSLLRRISGAVISTIHAFGQRLISQNALDLGIAPDFSVLEDDEAERILKEVMAGELRKTLSSGTPEEREPLEELCLGRKPGKLVADTGEFLRRCESRGLEISVIAPEELVPPPPPPKAAALREMEEYYLAAAGEKPAAAAERFREGLEDKLSSLPPDAAPGDVAAAAGVLLAELGGGWGKEGMKTVREKMKSRLVLLAGYPEQLKARKLLIAFLGYAGRALRAYEETKRERGAIDFTDLLLRSRDLVRESPGVLPPLSVIIIDEAQDNSRAQNELVEAIRERTGAALVLCGDVKQTIHTWRGADPEGLARLAGRRKLIPVPLQVSYRSRKSILDWVNEIFRETVLGKEKYGPDAELRPCPEAPAGEEPGVELLLPEWEFRPGSVAVPKKKPEEKRGLELTGKDLAALAAAGDPAGGILPGQWQKWLDDYPDRHSDEARAVAERISLLCRPGADPAFRPREIYDPETRWKNDRTTYRYRDITILLRATSRQEVYEAALRERSIPYTGVGKGRGFYFRQEVRDVSSLLKTLAFPRDDLARLAVLRSPFFSLSDRAIGILTAGFARRKWTGWLKWVFSGAGAAALRAAGLSEEAEAALRAARILQILRSLAGRWNGTDLVRRAIDLTGYDAVLAGSFNGLQKLANLRLLLSQLAERERKDRLDLAGLARFLAAEIEKETPASDAAVLDPSNDAVVISTIHAAKGLSSPVVFIPDLRRTLKADSSWLRVAESGSGLPAVAGKLRVIGEEEDELDLPTADWEKAKASLRTAEAEEEKRLFYVAATRGRDLVVLSGENAGASGSWRGWLNRYLLDSPGGRELVRLIPYPELKRACSSFGGEEDLPPLPSAERLAARPTASAAHPLPESYRLSVTVLAGVPERFAGESADRWRRRLGEYARTGLINLPPLYLMTRAANEGEGEEGPAEEGREEAGDLLSLRIGTGIFGHAVLEKLDFSRPPAGQIREAAAGYGGGEREQSALGRQLGNAAAALARLLEGADPEKIIREFPFSTRFDHDGAEVIVDGAIDLLFFKDGAWRIVDYKFSGRPASELKKKYGLQLAIYREAVSRAIPGSRARTPLFREGTEPAPFTMTILGIGPDGKVREVEIGEGEAGDVPARAVAAVRLIRAEASP
jgi:ATP-dependent helicase/nuclease subunit A